ncbi:unnamed protein product [Caenorhabditis brenneri]
MSNEQREKNEEPISLKENGGGTSEAVATPPASPPESQLPSPLVAEPIAEKESESKEKIQAVEQIGGEQEEGQGPTDGEEVPQAEPPAIEELEDDVPDPAPILRRSSRAKAQKRRRYGEEY